METYTGYVTIDKMDALRLVNEMSDEMGFGHLYNQTQFNQTFLDEDGLKVYLRADDGDIVIVFQYGRTANGSKNHGNLRIDVHVPEELPERPYEIYRSVKGYLYKDEIEGGTEIIETEQRGILRKLIPMLRW